MAKNKLKIAILSGKGGTGKTFVSVNLASVATNSQYIDCDVEEPNGHLFFKPTISKKIAVNVKIPKVDETLCNGCRSCVNFCNFNALAYVNKKVKVFENLCHSCGGCALICPQKAIYEEEKGIGVIEMGTSDNISVCSGILNMGELSGVPIIKELLTKSFEIKKNISIIDCPPGNACTVMESIKGNDFAVLVAEPTIFGVHNLGMVYELVKLFNIPHAVVLNKCMDSQPNPAENFCKDKKITIMAKINFDLETGKTNSNGNIVVKKNCQMEKLFSTLLDKIIKETKK